MASRRRQRRQRERARKERAARQCTGKVVYPTARAAKRAAEVVGHKKGTLLKHYPCPVCSTSQQTNWHIGHDPAIRGSGLLR